MTLSSQKLDSYLLKVPVKDNGEALVDLKLLINKNGPSITLAIGQPVYLRRSVAQALLKAAKHFNNIGYGLKVESTYRSLAEQKIKFKRRYKLLKKQYPKLTKDEIIELAGTYTGAIPVLAAHTAGAAVDVLLIDLKTGDLIDFGVPYPHGGVEAHGDYRGFNKPITQNRQVLRKGMEKFGFVNYPFEYWHFSIGDVCAAYLTGQREAIFAPINFDGKQQQLLDSKLIRRPFGV